MTMVDGGGGVGAVTDESGALSMEVPADWGDVDSAPEDLAGVTADAPVMASTDVAAFREGYDEPGASLSTSAQLATDYTSEEFLDLPDKDYTDGCGDTARAPYNNGMFTGYIDAYTGCGEAGNEAILMAAVPTSEAYMFVLAIQTAPDNAGKQAQERVIQTANIYEALLP